MHLGLAGNSEVSVLNRCTMSHRLSWRIVQVLLLALGFVTLATLLHHIGPMRIYTAATELGPAGMVIIFLPSLVMYLLDCVGWRMTLGAQATAIPFFKLFLIRTAGEVVNATTPTGSVGGEPVKAYLLAKYGIPMVDGFASVILAKTTMTIAQIVYTLVGFGLGFWLVSSSWETSGLLAISAIVASLGLVLFGTALLIIVQRRGFFTILFTFLQKCRLQIVALEARREKLVALDRAIVTFYSRARSAFLLSTVAFLCGWLVEGIEVYLMLRYLGAPIDLLTALSIDAVSTFIKGATFVVPGSIGAQEAGNLMLLEAYGHSEVIGMTFALLRRFREVVWIVIGIVCLMLLKIDRVQADQPNNED